MAGVIVDRSPKRRLLLGTQMALMLPAFALAGLIWTGWIRYWHVATLAGVIGVVNALDMPSRQSFTVEMVGRDDLMNAIALNSATFNAARVTGPALGGYLIARYGTAVAFLLNGLSFLAVVVALAAVRAGSEARPRQGTTVRQEILDGVRYATRTPLIASILSARRRAQHVRAEPRRRRPPLRARGPARGCPRLRPSHGVARASGPSSGPSRSRRSARAARRWPPWSAPRWVSAGGLLALAFVRQFALVAALLLS